MNTFNQIPEQTIIDATIAALKTNGIESVVVDTGAEAKTMAIELIPEGSEVMTMSSVTLETIGLVDEFNQSGKYNAVKPKLMAMNRDTQKREMKQLGTAPEYCIGSVHAVTQDGKVLIASNTGSQLPAYVYGSDHVIWIVGAQKIVANLDEGMARLESYVLPLESEHMMKLHGVTSFVSKLLIVNREITPGRVTVIFVKEVLGF